MSNDRNLMIAERWFRELWSKPDLGVADEIVAENYAPEWIQIEVKGPEQVKHEIRYFRSIFPNLKYQIVDAVATEKKVWVRYKGMGRQQGKAWGFESTGKEVSFEGVTILTMNEEGKIVDRWGAFSFYDILSDLGLAPPLWELSKYLKEYIELETA